MADCTPVFACFVFGPSTHVAQVLPAGGAFTSQSFFELRTGSKGLTYYVTYTRGGPGGYAVFQPQWGDGDGQAYRELILEPNSLVTVDPNAEIRVYLENILGPIPQDASAIRHTMEFKIPAGASQARLLVAERGPTATPGTIAVTLTGDGGC